MFHIHKNEIWDNIPDDKLNIIQFLWLIFAGFFLGFVVGLVIAFFKITSHMAYHFVINWARPNEISAIEISIFIALALLAAIITGLLIRNKDIRLGGATWIQAALIAGQKNPFFKILIPKFVGIWLVMAFGVSVGSEGPSIQIGAATGMSLMRGVHGNIIKRHFYILGGCAAGLAAVFSAPFSGICYVYEVMREKIERLLLIFMLAGSFGVYVSVSQICGLGMLLPLGSTPLPPPPLFLLVLPLGILAGITGIAYNACLSYSLNIYAAKNLIPIYLRPIFPFLASALLILYFPSLTGEGLGIFKSILAGESMLSFLCLFIGAKLLFTAFCFGSRIPAGLMVPILCLGGVLGTIYGNVCMLLGLMTPEYINSFIAMGMAGAFAASERAPITGLAVALEMTGSWVAAPGILLVAGIASFCGRFAKIHRI